MKFYEITNMIEEGDKKQICSAIFQHMAQAFGKVGYELLT